VNTAVLTEPGRGKLTELSRRAVVLAAIASLHALIAYLLANDSPGSYGRLDASVIEAEVIPTDRPIPDPPPPFPPVMLQGVSSIDLPSPQIAIDVPAEQVAATEAIDTRDLGDSQLPVTAGSLPQVDPSPVVRPRPIAGPRGVDRYPKASIRAKESGTVVMNICVSPSGKVDSVELASSSGFPRLDQVALGIASEYQFQPAMRQGHPIAACAHYRIVFKVV
jgi:periplasmic protein TonB